MIFVGDPFKGYLYWIFIGVYLRQSSALISLCPVDRDEACILDLALCFDGVADSMREQQLARRQ